MRDIVDYVVDSSLSMEGLDEEDKLLVYLVRRKMKIDFTKALIIVCLGKEGPIESKDWCPETNTAL